jgi:hypothetical protein
VFNSKGAVIGVVTRKSAAQEALAFCIPIEDLNLAIEKIVTFPEDAIEREQSRHRLILTVKELGGSGALYSSVINLRRQKASADNAGLVGGYYDAAIAHLEKQTFPRLKAEAARVRDDVLVSQALRDKVGQLADNLVKLRALYTADNAGKGGNDSFSSMKARHRRLLVELCKALKLDVPANILFALDDSSEKVNAKGAPKGRSAKPGLPEDKSAKPASPTIE